MIANSNTTAWSMSTGGSEQNTAQVPLSHVNVAQTSCSTQCRTSCEGPVAILWDIENCPVPSDVRPDDVAGYIRMALRIHPIINGAVTMFSAYGDFNAFPRRVREGCQRTGVKLIDVPNGRKDAADKAILVDMFLFALDNPPPSSIMLISGDVDFAPALHILGQRGYTVILVIPSGVGVSSALCNAGRFLWDWPSVARGEGFVPPTKSLMGRRGGSFDIAGFLKGCHISENVADGHEEEAIVYRGISQSYYNSRDYSIVSQSLSEYSGCTSAALPVFTTTIRSQTPPSGFNEVTAGTSASGDQSDMNLWVQPGDVNGLKGQLVKLLELSGGCLPIVRVPSEYQKVFNRPLYISEYGSFKLVNLLKKMSDVLSVGGRGQKKFVCLRNVKSPASAPLLPVKKDERGKGIQEEILEGNAVCGSSDELSDEEKVVVEEHGERRAAEKLNSSMAGQCETEEQNLLQFKLEMEEILVSFSCRIFLGSFEEIYQQRYKKPLDHRRFGVNELEELFEKVRDVVVLHVEPVTKKKFLSAVLW